MNNRFSARRQRNKQFEEDDFFDDSQPGNDDYQEPDKWTIITALDRVLELARHSELKQQFWDRVEHPLKFLTEELELTKMQVVFLAILVEAGEPLSWRRFGSFLGCTRLSMMVYTDEVEEMVRKRWFVRKVSREMGTACEGFALVHGVVTALRHNQRFEPEKIDGLSEQEFVEKMAHHVEMNSNDRSIEFKDDEEWLDMLCQANKHLPLCQAVLELDSIHARSLLLMIVCDYAEWADSDGEGYTMHSIENTFPQDIECSIMCRRLRDGSHVLIERGLIEDKCEDGIADNETYVLSRNTKEELLANYKPTSSPVRPVKKKNKYLKSVASIKEKELFYNDSEQEQVDRLTSLLSQENLPSVQQRLEEQGLRKGFACLFYGGPGTGKTETVLQIARKTGRDIMQIDIAGLRDKYVGESEKNIKGVFAQYRELCMNSEVMPILFFNEADGIFGKRIQNVERSVEKMDNAMQNIILQEMEDLEGLLIATTNLTENLDSAFERRFLFKVEFHKPDTEVKAKIWCSMLKNISEEDAHILARKFDFSGGQIENIARKRTIDFILNGDYADIDAIEGYCRNELLENKKACRPVVGFGA